MWNVTQLCQAGIPVPQDYHLCLLAPTAPCLIIHLQHFISSFSPRWPCKSQINFHLKRPDNRLLLKASWIALQQIWQILWKQLVELVGGGGVGGGVRQWRKLDVISAKQLWAKWSRHLLETNITKAVQVWVFFETSLMLFSRPRTRTQNKL